MLLSLGGYALGSIPATKQLGEEAVHIQRGTQLAMHQGRERNIYLDYSRGFKKG